MSIKKFIYRIFIISVMLTCMLLASAASAEVFNADPEYSDSSPDDYITKQFDVNVTVSKNHVYHVEETISVEFIAGHHGIYRYLPEDERYYELKNVKVAYEEYDTEWEGSTDNEGYYNGTLILQIGDGDETLTGDHTYYISYDIAAHPDYTGADNYFSLNLIPNGWGTSIRSVKVTFTMPEAIDQSALDIYGGLYGSSELVPFTISDDGKTFSIEAKNLPVGYGITAHADLPDKYWTGPVQMGMSIYSIIAAIILVIGLIIYVVRGRKPAIIETVEFYPPDKLTPAEVGYIVDGTIDDKDISSMLMYFASKGYLKIDEYEEGKFKLIKLKDIDTEFEKAHSLKLFNGIFKIKDTVYVSKLPKSYHEAVSESEASINDEYIKKNTIYKKRSSLLRFCIYALVCILIAVFAFYIKQRTYRNLSLYIVLGSLIPFAVSFFLSFSVHDRMRSSTKKNQIIKAVFAVLLDVAGFILIATQAYIVDIPAMLITVTAVILLQFIAISLHTFSKEHADLVGRVFGFRNFIETAEYEKLKLLSDSDPEYYFNILPYAMVMGLETNWSKKFTDIVIANPMWFEPYGDRFYRPVVFCSMMNDCRNTYSQSFADVTSTRSGSSGGGFSGGFSGGGFGGGGGGAW